MSTLAKEKAAATQEFGKLKKLIAIIKKVFAKEFLWIVVALILGLPLAMVLTYLLEEYGTPDMMETVDSLLQGKSLFVGSYLASLGGIYFTRTVASSIVLLLNKKPKAE